MELGSFTSVSEMLLDYSLSDTSVSASKRDLIREKRERLLSNPTQVNSAIQNLNPTVKRIFDLYKKQDSYWERTLFYIRDLLIADSKKLLDKKQRRSLRISLIAIFFNPYTLPQGSQTTVPTTGEFSQVVAEVRWTKSPNRTRLSSRNIV